MRLKIAWISKIAIYNMLNRYLACTNQNAKISHIISRQRVRESFALKLCLSLLPEKLTLYDYLLPLLLDIQMHSYPSVFGSLE